MASFAATFRLFVLLGFIGFSAANKDVCDHYAGIGQRMTLNHVGLANTVGLRWTHNKTIIFHRQQGKVSVGNEGDVSKTGSLLLKDLKFSSSGVYEAHELRPNGTLTNSSWSTRLCVLEVAPKPQLRYVCDYKSGAVNLDCFVADPQGLTFSWTLGDQTLKSETKRTLSVSLSRLRGDRSFTCSVANRVSNTRSDPVRPACQTTRPSPPPPVLFCLKSKIAAAILGGGSSLILLLLTVIFALCCCRKRDKTRLRRRDVEMTRLSQSKRDPDSAGPVYETMHEAGDVALPPSRRPDPESCYQNVSQPEVGTENGPSQLTTAAAAAAAEDQRPSPVPKPRTKAPQTQNV